MFSKLEKVLSDLISNQKMQCNKIVRTDSNPVSDTTFLKEYLDAYDEYVRLRTFYDQFSIEDDDSFE